MGRPWSVRLSASVRRWGDAMLSLWPGRHRAFVAAATLAHLTITALGIGTLTARATGADDSGAGLADISVALFLVTGGITAVLLWHISRAAPAMPARLALAGRCGRLPPFHPGLPVGRPSQHRVAAPTLASDHAIALERGASHTFCGLMSHVSHELRTPLNAIIGFADLMQRELLGPLGSPRYQEYVRHIRESGLAVLKAAEDTMAFTTLLADRGRVHVEAVDIDALLDEACRQAAGSAAVRNIEIVRGPSRTAWVRAEPGALGQALCHLVSAGVLRAQMGRPVFINLRVVGSTVRLGIAFGADAAHTRLPTHPSHAIARALLELQGFALAERRTRNGGWRVTATLPLAMTISDIAAPTQPAHRRSAHAERIAAGAVPTQ